MCFNNLLIYLSPNSPFISNKSMMRKNMHLFKLTCYSLDGIRRRRCFSIGKSESTSHPVKYEKKD